MTRNSPDRRKKGKIITEEYEIVGETADGMPVATKDETWFFLTDGEYLHTDGYLRIDPLGSYRYVCWYTIANCKEVALNPERIDFDNIEVIRERHETA